MIHLPRPHTYRIMFALLCATILGAACITSASDDGADSNWQNYYNAKSGFSFRYPPGWEVIDAFFYKGSYVATIQRIGGDKDTNNWIRVNSPQFMEEDGKCIVVDEQRICTYSRDAEVLNIFQQVAASFKRELTEDNQRTHRSEAEWFGQEETK